MHDDLKKLDSLLNVMGEFDAAARHLSLTADQVALLKEPRFSVKLRCPVLMDNGSIKVFKAFHTIHSTMRGPSIGGIQIRTDVLPERVEALAFWSSHKCSLLGIPFGGSAGAIECDPTELSVGELERLSRRYVADLKNLVGGNNDILTADIGSNQQTMCWFMDTFSANHGKFLPDVVAGKPLDIGGSRCTTYPVAIGACLCIKKACELKKINLKGSRVAIQGFGKVGANLAKLLNREGALITTIADVSGAYFNENGINVQEAIWHHDSYGILDGLMGSTEVVKLDDPMEIFSMPVDILIPAAIELQITEQNVKNVKAKIVAEVAHDPVSPSADNILLNNGALVIPDILCNSGGVAGYYLEWVQNRTGYYWSQEQVEKEVLKIVGNAFDSVTKIMASDNISMRIAAAVLAVKRLNKASELRGVYA